MKAEKIFFFVCIGGETVTMKRAMSLTAGVVFALSFSATCFSGDLIVYPAKGQSKDQMEKDKYQCYSWAKEQTGFDPMLAPKATAPPPPKEAPQGGVGRGAARGALAGLAVGAIAGDAGKGAAIGAASGGLIGGMRRRDQVARQEQTEKQWAQQQAANYNKGRTAYNRAYGACLEGRGYTVR
jgi:hypothetical protein